jgi:hypothetical protein
MSGPTSDSQSRQHQLGLELALKEWRRPDLRKLPIAATANSQGKNPSNHDDGNSNKSGDVTNLS